MITRLGTYPQIKGSPYKIPCRVATDTDVTLTGGTPNQVDGINLSVGDRILVKSQSTTSQNGIYYVEILGSGSNGTWMRSVDLSINDDIFQGVTIFVSEGTLYGGTLFVINTPNPIDLGTTSYGFDIAFSGGTGSSGLSGLEGISGISGLEGISGISGIEGISGLEGLSGISGLEGNSGISGISGLEGISGISGLEGLSGISGISGLSGTSGISGLSGISGIEGISGLEGLSGISGLEGNSGISGISGLEGVSGISGLEGLSGISGIVGQSGLSGISGLVGNSGISGLEGVSGISGLQGISGIGFSAVTNFSDNRILTSDGTANAATAEPNLTFDGTTLRITGQTTQQYSGPSGFTMTGTYTTAVNSTSYVNIAPNITSRNTASDVVSLFTISGSLVATANAQSLVGLNIAPSYTGFGSGANITRRWALIADGTGLANGSQSGVFLGSSALGYPATGFGSINIGHSVTPTTGVFIGYQSGTNSAAAGSIAIGNRSAFQVSSSYGIFIGADTGYGGGGVSTGCVLLGGNAGTYRSVGGFSNSYSACTYLGFDITNLAASDVNAIAVGYGASSQGSNSVVIGNNNITRTFLKGDVGLGYTPTTASTTLDGRLDVVGSSSVTGNALKVANSTPTTLFVVQNVGNVGIGPTSPTSKLHVSGTTNIATFVGSGGTIYYDGTALNITGQTTQQYNGPSGLTFNGTYTTTASLQPFLESKPNITLRNTASDVLSVWNLSPTIVSTANAQTAIGLNINTTYTTFGSGTNLTRAWPLMVNGMGIRGGEAGNVIIGDNYKSASANRVVSVGFGASITTGVHVGFEAGANVSTGYDNVIIGYRAMFSAGAGSAENVAIGNRAAQGILGNDNVVIGWSSLWYQADGSTAMSNANNSVYIGTSVRGFNNSDSNSIVIGYAAIGQGANTVVLGNNSVTKTILKGDVGLGYTPTTSSQTLDAKLDILGSSSVSGNTMKLADSNSTPIFVVQNVGNVGIGPTSPTSKLHVSGTTNIATFVGSGGTLYFDGTTLNFSGSSNANFQDNLLVRPEMKDYSETYSSPSIVSSALTLNLENGNVFNVSLDSDVTTFTISNPPASGKTGSFTLVLTADGTPRTITWGGNIKWGSVGSPTLTSDSGRSDIFSFMSLDGGSNWYAFIAGQAF